MDLVAIFLAFTVGGAAVGFVTHVDGYSRGWASAEDRIAQLCADDYSPSFDVVRDDKVWTFQCDGPTTREIKPWDKQ